METLKIKKVGEFQILDGFDLLGIDPEMTRIANKEELAKLPEQVAVDEKVKQKNAFLLQKTEARKNAGRAHGIIVNEEALIAAEKSPEKVNLIKIEVQNAKAIKAKALKKVEEHSKNCDVCDAELDKLNMACDLKRKEHIKANLIYNHPPAGQIGIFTDGFDISVLKEAYENRENQQIVIESKTIEKEVLRIPGKDPIAAPFLEYSGYKTIADFRGCQYFYHDGKAWVESEVITDLGVTMETVVVDSFHGSAIEKKDLTQEQLEEMRVQKLSDEDKATEKAQAIDSAATQAATMKTKLEIQGSTAAKALSDSKTWYQEQLTEINEKYA